MATLFSCDRCKTQLPAADEGRKEWSDLKLAKLSQPTVPFQTMDLCPHCTSGLRNFLAAGSNLTGVT